MHTTPTPSRALRRARTHTGQAGFSLVEVLISVALVGMVVLALAAGLLTLVRTEAATAERQRIELALANYSEGLRAVPYRDCTVAGNATEAAYEAAYSANPVNWVPPAGIAVEIVDVRFWDKANREFDDACGAADQGAQEFSLRATYRDRDGHTQIVVGDR